MSNLAENGHPIAFVPELDPRESPGVNPLTPLEVSPVGTGVRAVPEAGRAFLRQLDEWAGQLAHPDLRNEGRLRHLARMIAALRTKLLHHETLREEALHKGDLGTALTLDRLVESGTRRLIALVREHREECLGGARTVKVAAVAVGARSQVNVIAGRTG